LLYRKEKEKATQAVKATSYIYKGIMPLGTGYRNTLPPKKKKKINGDSFTSALAPFLLLHGLLSMLQLRQNIANLSTRFVLKSSSFS
jgi:hypothetical protein